MALDEISIFVVYQAPQNVFCQHVYAQGEFSLASCLSRIGGSLRSASGSVSGSFQITASARGLGACEILCAPFRDRVSFPQPHSSPIHKPHWPPKPDGLGALGARVLGWGAQCEAQTPHSLEIIFAIVIILPFVSHLPAGVGLD